jgi:multidrug efflux pump subunit AcrB
VASTCAIIRGFNKAFDVGTSGYLSTVRILVRRSLVTILIVAAVAAGAGMFARLLPAGFIPDEDQGVFGVNVQLPPGSSLVRTSDVLEKKVKRSSRRPKASKRIRPSAATAPSPIRFSQIMARSFPA